MAAQSAGSQISHQVSVNLVAVHDHVQIGIAHPGRSSRLLVVHRLQDGSAIVERIFQRLADLGLFLQTRSLLLAGLRRFRLSTAQSR